MLKIIAIVSMLIDHIGLLLLNNNFYFRYVGRIAFPIFAILIAYNYFYRTNNKNEYFNRLLLFALISEPFYIFAFALKLNIFFQFLLGIVNFNMFDYFLEKRKLNNFLGFAFIFFASLIISEFADYGVTGFLLVFVLMNYFAFLNKDNILKVLAIFTIWLLLLCLNSEKYLTYSFIVIAILIFTEKIENYKQDFFRALNKKYKYFFYWFYPLHMFILKLIKIIGG